MALWPLWGAGSAPEALLHCVTASLRNGEVIFAPHTQESTVLHPLSRADLGQYGNG
jgi:hypothetical protein